MAKHDSTELLTAAVGGGTHIVDPSGTSPGLAQCRAQCSTVTGPVLGVVQLEALRTVFSRRVTAAVASIPDAATQRAAIITCYRKMGSELLARFDVKDVVDIPSTQFGVAHQFLERVALDCGRIAQARA